MHRCPFAFACFHPSLCMALMGGMLIIARPHGCPFSPRAEEAETRDGRREVRQHPALRRLSRHVRYASHGTPCAWPTSANATPDAAKPRASSPSPSPWVNKICPPPAAWLWPEWQRDRLARVKVEEEEGVGGEAVGG